MAELTYTEGVWMSVTPTDEELIVALDFEGRTNCSFYILRDRPDDADYLIKY
jgi:hypothetical protein